MIVTQDDKKYQIQERLKMKSAEEAFAWRIVDGTNCSRFEAPVIVDTAKQMFGIGAYSEQQTLHDGQMVFYAVSEKAPPGVTIKECEKKRVVLTHVNRAQDIEVWREHGASAKRRQQMMRMAVEAQEQEALLTQEDLSLILDSDVRTIRSDIAELKKAGIIVPTRGTIRDIGPGVTHKRKAVELWLSGKEELEVARQLNHSLRAVERYIRTYCRVVYTQRELRNTYKTALVVGISVSAVNTYFDLHQEMMESNSFYRKRIEEVLHIGEEQWEMCDEKKSHLQTGKQRKGEQR